MAGKLLWLAAAAEMPTLSDEESAGQGYSWVGATLPLAGSVSEPLEAVRPDIVVVPAAERALLDQLAARPSRPVLVALLTADADVATRQHALLTADITLPATASARDVVERLRRLGSLGARRDDDSERRRYEALLQSVLESTTDAVFAVDHEYRLMINNARHRQVLLDTGGRELHVGDNVFPPEYPAEVLAHWRAAYDTAMGGGEARMDAEWFDRSGVRRWFENRVSPLRDHDGEIIGAMIVARDITEWKAAEVALREREAALRTVFDHSLIGLEMFDKQGVLLRTNHRAAEIFGTDAALQTGVFRLQDDPHLQSPDIWERLRRGQDVQRELSFEFSRVTYPTSRVGTVDLFVQITPIPEQVSAHIGYVVQVLELTQLRRAERLRRVILDNIPDSVWMKDDGGRILDVNKSWSEFTGIARDRAIGAATAELSSPALLRLFGRAESRVVAGDLVREEQRLEQHGTVHVFEAVQAPVFDGTGAVCGLVGIARDITERKRVEEDLRQSEAELRQAQQIAKVGSWSLRRGASRLRCSEEFGRIFGFTDRRREIALGELQACIRPDDWSELFPANGARDDEAVREVQVRATAVTGVEVELRWGVRCRVDADGQSIEWEGTAQDITAQQRLESSQRQSQKLEAIGRLAGGVAHDFNNLLGALLAQAELLQVSQPLGRDASELVDEMKETARRGAALTRQLLLFSRRSAPSRAPVRLERVVLDLLRMLQRLIRENVTLQFDGGRDVPTILADAGMLDQLLTNLVVNARDALPDGGEITVRVAAVTLGEAECRLNDDRRPGDFVCLTVEDNGLGMTPETLKRIFEPFFTTKAVGQGTGMGLATVQGIVAQHEGWLEVASVEGVGSTFRVYFPATSEVAAEPPPVNALPKPATSSVRILLVEDDASLRRVARRLLHALGHSVIEASNGEAAHALWPEVAAEVDLLITDMVMPGLLNGLELARRLLEQKPALRALICSGYAADVAGGLDALEPAITFLAKPYNLRELSEAIAASLAGAGAESR